MMAPPSAGIFSNPSTSSPLNNIIISLMITASALYIRRTPPYPAKQAVHHVRDSEIGGVHFDCIFRLTQWRDFPMGIEMIPLPDLFLQFSKVNFKTRFSQLFLAPQGPLFHCCPQKKLPLGIRHHNCPYIPTVHDYPTRSGNFLLHGHDQFPQLSMA